MRSEKCIVQLPERDRWDQRKTITDKLGVVCNLKGLKDNGIVNAPMRMKIGHSENKGEISDCST